MLHLSAECSRSFEAVKKRNVWDTTELGDFNTTKVKNENFMTCLGEINPPTVCYIHTQGERVQNLIIFFLLTCAVICFSQNDNQEDELRRFLKSDLGMSQPAAVGLLTPEFCSCMYAVLFATSVFWLKPFDTCVWCLPIRKLLCCCI